MKVKLSRGIAQSADSPIPPQNNCFLQEKNLSFKYVCKAHLANGLGTLKQSRI